MKDAKKQLEMSVFVETSLSTHIVMGVSPDTTAGDLKRELGTEHSICFPSIGEININGLMVKKRSCYYHLPDSFPVKDAFHGLKGTWFLHVDVTPSNHSDKHLQSESVAAEIRDNDNSGIDVTGNRRPEDYVTCAYNLNIEDKSRQMEREGYLWSDGIPGKVQTPVNISKNNKKKEKKHSLGKSVEGIDMFFHLPWKTHVVSLQEQSVDCDDCEGMNNGGGWTSQPTIETSSVTVSEAVSVSALITRYFPEFDEVKSFDGVSSCALTDEFGASGCNHDYLHKPLKSKSDALTHKPHQRTSRKPSRIIPPPSPDDPRRRASRGKVRTEVGKRFVVAANGLRNSTYKKKSSLTTCQSRGGMLSSSVEKIIVFEVSDSVD